MKQTFSNSWKNSIKPRKQRKYRIKAPLHLKKKFIRAHLSKELRETHKRRSAGLKKGDKVKIMRGNFKGKTGKIESINVKRSRIIVAGIETTKKDGTKVPYPLTSSNLLITELKIEDKMRKKAISKNG